MSGKAALKIVVGSILAAYGLTLAVYAGFGGATLAIFWQGVANGVVPGTLQKPANKIPRTPMHLCAEYPQIPCKVKQNSVFRFK